MKNQDSCRFFFSSLDQSTHILDRQVTKQSRIREQCNPKLYEFANQFLFPYIFIKLPWFSFHWGITTSIPTFCLQWDKGSWIQVQLKGIFLAELFNRSIILVTKLKSHPEIWYHKKSTNTKGIRNKHLQYKRM